MYYIQLGPVVYSQAFTLVEAMREVYGVGYAKVLRADGTVVVRDAGSSVAVLHTPTERVVNRRTARWLRRRELAHLV